MANDELNLNEILLLRRERLQELMDEGKNPFLIEKYDVKSKSSDIKDNFDELEDTETSVAGRVMSKRGHGKISFLDIQDSQGRIQIFARKDALEDSYEDVKKLDIGDIVGVKGTIFKTKEEKFL